MSHHTSTDAAFKVAVAHMAISADIHKNSNVIQELTRHAAKDNCRLIQFPEGALSGYCKTQITAWDTFDWATLQQELDIIKQLAKECRIWIVVGVASDDALGELPKNSLVVIADTGEIHTRYDKRYISHGELQGWYSPGHGATTFQVGELTFGLALCLEVQFTEVFEEYRELGVDVVLLSAYADDPMFEVTARAHASLNNYWVGFSVPSNTPKPLSSSLVGPDGYIQASSATDKSGLAIAELNPQDPYWDIPLNKAKPWRKLARQGDIYRG